jgi:hypothetical protein
MSDVKKPPRPAWPLPSPTASPAKPSKSDREAAGKVVHDDRGNAVWDWSRAPTDSTTHLLRKLESPELALADEAGKPQAAPADPHVGLDPYNKGTDAQKKPAATARPEAPPKEPASKDPKGSVLKQLLGKR